MSDKIKQFPRGTARTNRLKRRKFQVPCQVSERWLQFPDTAHPLAGGDFMAIDVMTLGSDEEPKKICELVLTKRDILRMIEQVETPHESET